MADNIDPQQIDALNENLKSLIETMGGVAAKGPGVSKSLGEMAGLGKNANAALGILGSSAAAVGGALYKGEKGAKVFSSAIEDASNALTLLVLAIPGLGIAAKVAAVATNLFAKGLNAASKQGDALYKTYQDLQKSGATASDGITGVFNNMQKFGYGIEELDKMVKLVSENSETLAQFSLTAADGTSAFASAMQGIVRDPALKLLGKTPDDINAAGAAFIRQQVAMGRTQTDIGDKLGSSTRQYVTDLDRLQRLTGTSADALQKQQDELLNEDAYNLYMENLANQGAAGTDQANKIKSVLAEFPQYQKEISAAIGGNIEAQGKLMFIMPSLIKNLQDPSVDFATTVKTAGAEVSKAKGGLGQLASYASDSTRPLIGSIKDMNKAMASSKDIDKRISAADKNTRVQDDATESLSDLDLQNMNSRDALQSFVQLGVAPATKAMDAFAKGTSKATSLLPGAGPAGQNSVAGKLDAMNAAGAKPMVPSGAGAAPAGEAKPVSPGPKGKEQQAYYDKMYDSLLKEAKAAGLKNAEVVAKLGAAQTSLETGYGKHMVGNNAFGIKAKQGGASVGASTQEFENGRMVTKNQNFRAYDKPEDSAKDYIKFLQENKRYKDVLGSNNLSDAIAAQGKTGYATDPNYANKLAGIAGTYGNTTGAKSNANDKIDQQLASMDKKTAQIQAQADNNRKQSYTTPASDSYKNQLSDLNKEAQAARDKLAATTAGPLTGYQSQLSGLNPSKTLPEKTDATQTAANLPAAGDDKHADLLSQILGSLDNLNHSNQQIASSTKKSVQLQS